MIIPTSVSSYNAILLKSARNENNAKYKAQNAGKKHLFNSAAIVPDEIVIVVEGEIDAMSIFQAMEGKACVIGNGGASNNLLIDHLKKKLPVQKDRQKYSFLILFDADETGRLNAPQLASKLVNFGCPAVCKFLADKVTKTDANDVLREMGDAVLKDNIDEILTAAQNELAQISKELSTTLQQPTDNQKEFILSDFLKTQFDSGVNQYRQFVDRKSKFENFDKYQIFNPGLYVIGATPACGKTTFCWQLLEQFALSGEKCVFFSYEMDLIQLSAKTIARQTFLADRQSTLSSADILRGGYSSTSNSIIQRLTQNSFPLILRECDLENVDELISIMKRHCAESAKPPIFCIDYVQIIPTADQKNLNTDKAKVDDIVHKLKTFSRESGALVFIISSFNRLNYNTDANLTSFKESGAIEYSADVVLALELVKPAANPSSMRELMLAQPRWIKLTCLKNRFGALYEVSFFYYSKFDYFEPCLDIPRSDIAEIPDDVMAADNDSYNEG